MAIKLDFSKVRDLLQQAIPKVVGTVFPPYGAYQAIKTTPSLIPSRLPSIEEIKSKIQPLSKIPQYIGQTIQGQTPLMQKLHQYQSTETPYLPEFKLGEIGLKTPKQRKALAETIEAAMYATPPTAAKAQLGRLAFSKVGALKGALTLGGISAGLQALKGEKISPQNLAIQSVLGAIFEGLQPVSGEKLGRYPQVGEEVIAKFKPETPQGAKLIERFGEQTRVKILGKPFRVPSGAVLIKGEIEGKPVNLPISKHLEWLKPTEEVTGKIKPLIPSGKITYKESRILPKGGAVAQNVDQMAGTAADIIGRRLGIDPEAVYNWAIKQKVDLNKIIKSGLKVEDPQIEKLIEAIIWNKPLPKIEKIKEIKPQIPKELELWAKENPELFKQAQEAAAKGISAEEFRQALIQERSNLRNQWSNLLSNIKNFNEKGQNISKEQIKKLKTENRPLLRRIKQIDDFFKGKSINDIKDFYNLATKRLKEVKSKKIVPKFKTYEELDNWVKKRRQEVGRDYWKSKEWEYISRTYGGKLHPKGWKPQPIPPTLGAIADILEAQRAPAVKPAEMTKIKSSDINLLKRFADFEKVSEAEREKVGKIITQKLGLLPEQWSYESGTGQRRLAQQALEQLGEKIKLKDVFQPKETKTIGEILKEKPSQMPPAGETPPKAPKIPKSPKEKYAFNINLNRMDLSAEEKQTLKKTVENIKPELEKIKGKKLSNDEVLKAAKTSEMLQQVTTREETLKAEAAILKARQRIVELDKEIDQLAKAGKTAELEKKMKDLIESLRVVSSTAADTGRKLQSFAIEAGDESLRQQVLKEIGKVEKDTDKILKEAVKVDWNNANSITSFYRKFVKPSVYDIFTEYRYNNMLSNPKTHLRNAFSNLVQTFFIRPGTLLFEAKPREAFKYYGGVLKSFPDAIEAFLNSYKGISPIEKPDLARIPTQKLPGAMTWSSRATEAADKFFSALIEGGELARGATPQEAKKAAEYFLFRGRLHPEEQGWLLNKIDDLTAAAYQLRRVGLDWFIPFIRTSMNFAKQWIEYSPMGVATLPGAANKREQLAKTLFGLVIAAIGAWLALEGRTTWLTPTDPKQKELFYASGRKPFSVKIGNVWVPMIVAGPLTWALALPAAAKYYYDESRTALTDSQLEKLGKTILGMVNLFSQQTFVQGLGSFVNLARGDIDFNIARNIAQAAQQTIPQVGLLRWIAQVLDPIYRRPRTLGEQFKAGLPILSTTVPAYKTPTGEPSKRLPINLFLPYDIGVAQPQYEIPLLQRQQKLQLNAVKSAIEKIQENVKEGIITPEEGNKRISELLSAVPAGAGLSLGIKPKAFKKFPKARGGGGRAKAKTLKQIFSQVQGAAKMPKRKEYSKKTLKEYLAKNKRMKKRWTLADIARVIQTKT